MKKEMGVNVGANVLTTGGLALATILIVVMGILLVSASNKVRELPEFESSTRLRNANNDLVTAYVLVFIAAGIGLLLGIAYAGHELAWCPSEWIHGLLSLVMGAVLIAGFVYAYIVLNNLYTPELEDRNGSDGFIWASLLVGSLAFIVLIGTGSGRIGYNVARGDVKHRVRHVEKKMHEVHSVVTGKPNDFVEPVDVCDGCEEPKPPCTPAPVPAQAMMVRNQGPVRLPAVPQCPQYQGQYQPQFQPQGQPQFQSPVRTQFQGQPQFQAQPQYQRPAQSQQFVGSPTVTRHSVVTTSQPITTSTQ